MPTHRPDALEAEQTLARFPGVPSQAIADCRKIPEGQWNRQTPQEDLHENADLPFRFRSHLDQSRMTAAGDFGFSADEYRLHSSLKPQDYLFAPNPDAGMTYSRRFDQLTSASISQSVPTAAESH